MIALMQEDTRIDRDEGGKNLSIGYYVMKVLRVETFSVIYQSIAVNQNQGKRRSS